MKLSTVLRRVSLSLLFIATSSLTLLAQEPSTYIKAGKLFDGRSNQLQENVVIVVQGKKILRVGKDVSLPSGATVIDLSQFTVMPGLIDAHTHLVLHAGDYDALTTSVKIAFGTDTFELPGTNAEELELMVRYGMKPAEALRAATSTAAALLDVTDITGTVEAGKSADIIAFRGNPFEDICSLQHVSFVMKEGKIFRQ